MNKLEKQFSELELHDEGFEGYVEPGYEQEHPDKPILFHNWNNVDEELMSYIEENYDIEWSDEWGTCQECGGAVRMQGNSYHWTPYYKVMNECELVCGNCIKEEPSVYLNELIDNPRECDTLELDLAKYGFKQYNGDFENGWYNRVDNPVDVLKQFKEKYPEVEFIFGNLCSSQFAVEFNLYGRAKGYEHE